MVNLKEYISVHKKGFILSVLASVLLIASLVLFLPFKQSNGTFGSVWTTLNKIDDNGNMMLHYNGLQVGGTRSTNLHKVDDNGNVLVAFATGTSPLVYTTVCSSGCDYTTDGVADDVQIQAAIDAVNTNKNGSVFIKEGVYNLSTSLNYRSNNSITGTSITIKGSGIDSTILRLNAGVATTSKPSVLRGYPEQATQPLNVYANASSTLEISDLTVDYNGANQTVNLVATGVLLDNTFRSSFIHNIKVTNVFVPLYNKGTPAYGIGINNYDARNVKVENCQFFNNDFGLWVTAYSQGLSINSVFSNNYISSSTGAGIYDEAGNNVLISGNYIEKTPSGIFALILDAGDAQIITNNIIATNTVTTLIETDASFNASIIQSLNKYVGIGDSTPSYSLDVSGVIRGGGRIPLWNSGIL